MNRENKIEYKIRAQSPKTVIKTSERLNESRARGESYHEDKLDTDRGSKPYCRSANKENFIPASAKQGSGMQLQSMLKENSERSNKPPKRERYDEYIFNSMNENNAASNVKKPCERRNSNGGDYYRTALSVSDQNIQKQSRK